MLLDGKTTTLLRKKLVRLFSPRKPRFLLTGDNALLLTAFALAFSPVSPLSVAAFAALKVSFPGACPGKDDFYFDEETTSSQRIRLLECFLFVLLFRFQGAFSRGENEFIKKVRGAALSKVNLLKKCAALLRRK